MSGNLNSQLQILKDFWYALAQGIKSDILKVLFQIYF